MKKRKIFSAFGIIWVIIWSCLSIVCLDNIVYITAKEKACTLETNGFYDMEPWSKYSKNTKIHYYKFVGDDFKIYKGKSEFFEDPQLFSEPTTTIRYDPKDYSNSYCVEDMKFSKTIFIAIFTVGVFMILGFVLKTIKNILYRLTRPLSFQDEALNSYINDLQRRTQQESSLL